MTERQEKIMRPLRTTSREFWPFVTALALITVVFIYAYTIQLSKGLGVTGLNDITIWGVYIVNFIFFIGLSHAGIAISAAVRIMSLHKYAPIARMAEVLTLASLMMAGSSIVIDLGRPDRAYLMVVNFASRIGASPLLWDITAVATYLILSTTYLYLPMREDLAICRDRFTGWRKRMYEITLPGYEVGEEKVIKRLAWWMAVTILPVMVMVHTTVSWIFSLLSNRPLWFGAAAGPYFIAAAVASGIASVVVIAAILRKLFHWEDLLPPAIFRGLGNFLSVITLIYLYLMLVEQFTARYAGPAGEFFVSEAWLFGSYATLFWSLTTIGLVLPCVYLLVQAFRPGKINITLTSIFSLFIVIAMWFKRYIIIVPTLTVGGSPLQTYAPSWVEITILGGSFAALALIYTILLKLIPIIEMEEPPHE
ncbi:polysulfide reductase NrfD [Candidatus Bathyarchaeota archaeon]|nr:polysulfide reductase NrfD [Candidatus Bathyarchaeota archaeon]MBL7078918.1 polysulfide reductase NrfD [Candidatus Bathyarchaeota archaeon]